MCNRSKFSITDKELTLIAAPAISGFSRPSAASGIAKPLYTNARNRYLSNGVFTVRGPCCEIDGHSEYGIDLGGMGGGRHSYDKGVRADGSIKRPQ